MWTVLTFMLLGAANDDLARAKSQYEATKYEAALKSLARAITAPGVTRADRAVIYLFTGLCRHQSGDEKGALAAFREALSIDRALGLPDGVPPKTALAFEQARAGLPPVPAVAPEVTAVTPPSPPPALPEPGPSVVKLPTAPAPAPEPRVKNWWPMGVSLGVAAAALATGLLFGNFAKQTSGQAQAQTFASDGFRLAQQAQTQAVVANVLFGTAGVAVAFGVVAAFVF